MAPINEFPHAAQDISAGQKGAVSRGESVNRVSSEVYFCMPDERYLPLYDMPQGRWFPTAMTPPRAL